jgi:hypothetical protein
VEFSRANTIREYERLITGLAACRDLKIRLADHGPQYASALHRFVADVANTLEAEWAEMVLCPTEFEQCAVASAGSLKLSDSHLRRVSSRLAWYAVNTAASTLVAPNDGLLDLGDAMVIDREPPAAMVAPLTFADGPFGALLLMRERPFGQRDLANLRCFARSVAPSLRAISDKSIFFNRGRAAIVGAADAGDQSDASGVATSGV